VKAPDAHERLSLSDGGREFLKTLTGIDPVYVPIFHGKNAARFAAAHRADALAMSGSIALGSSYVGETPGGLGLIAHELTHVARQREPRFVPPVARRPAATHAIDIDEETLATRVEARVISWANTPGYGVPALTPAPLELPSAPSHERSESLSPGGVQDFHAERWGGLPAPWEPLPDWFTAAPADGEPTAQARTGSVSDGSEFDAPGPATPPFGAVAADATSTTAIQRAEPGREVSEGATYGAPHAGGKEDPKPPPPDVDALARQVYTALKRRLETEMRRERV
jgi:hypothetical protein